MARNESGTTIIIVIVLLLVVISLFGLVFFYSQSKEALPSKLDEGVRLKYRLPIPEDWTDKEKRETLDTTVEIFKKRIDGLGLKEIGIRSQGVDEIRIDMPLMSEAMKNSIMEIIESQGQVEWLIVPGDESDGDDPSKRLGLDEKRKELIEYLKELEEKKGGWNLDTDLSPLSFSLTLNGEKASYLWMARSEDALMKDNMWRRKDGASTLPIPDGKTKFENLDLADIKENSELIERYFLLVKQYDKKDWQFSGGDLNNVGPSFDRNLNPAVSFELNSDRAQDFEEFTEAHKNQKLAILFDGKVHSDPVINTALPGKGVIQGGGQMGFSLEEQKHLLIIIQSGSLAAKPVLVSEEPFGEEK